MPNRDGICPKCRSEGWIPNSKGKRWCPIEKCWMIWTYE